MLLLYPDELYRLLGASSLESLAIKFMSSVLISVGRGGLGLWCLTTLSTKLWHSILLVEETAVPGENHLHAA